MQIKLDEKVGTYRMPWSQSIGAFVFRSVQSNNHWRTLGSFAVVILALVLSFSMSWAQSQATATLPATEKKGEFDKLERRFQILEERLRENERMRKSLVAEMERLREDLAKFKSGEKLSQDKVSGADSSAPGDSQTPYGQGDMTGSITGLLIH